MGQDGKWELVGRSLIGAVHRERHVFQLFRSRFVIPEGLGVEATASLVEADGPDEDQILTGAQPPGVNGGSSAHHVNGGKLDHFIGDRHEIRKRPERLGRT